MEFVTATMIGKRLGLSVATAWRYARKGRFGQPVNAEAKHWKFADDEVLAFMLANCRHPRRTLWQDGPSGHKRRLAEFADGSRSTDSEDREMAAGLLMIAARRHERRAAGRSSPATTCAEAVVRELMQRKHAGDPLVLQMLVAAAQELSGNGRVPA